MVTKQRQLADLLLSCFTLRELEMWLGFDHPSLVDEIAWQREGSAVAYELVTLLERRGVVNQEFFDSIRKKVPGRLPDVDEVAEDWLGASGFLGDAEVHPDLEPRVRLHFRASAKLAAPAADVYAAMRDHMVEISTGLPHVLQVEPQYTRIVSTGLWSGHLFTFGPGNNEVLGPLLRTSLADWLDVLFTACQHAVWDDTATRSIWCWEHLYYDARQVYEFVGAGARTEVRCASLYSFYPDRMSDPLLRPIARGALEGVRPNLQAFLAGCITDFLSATGDFLAARPSS